MCENGLPEHRQEWLLNGEERWVWRWDHPSLHERCDRAGHTFSTWPLPALAHSYQRWSISWSVRQQRGCLAGWLVD
eukprot:362555-Chlamydomonas_euryale.AAC.3